MPSTFTSSLRLENQATGENDSTWGDIADTNFQLIEDSITGLTTITHSDAASVTLSTANGATDEARRMALRVSGTLTANREVICPAVQKLYFIHNNTSGGFSVTLKTPSGSGIAVPNGKRMVLYCDGTNVVNGVDNLPSGATLNGGVIYSAGGSDVALADGGTGASLADPNADRILFWDDSAGAVTWLTPSTHLSISGTDLAVSTGTSGASIPLLNGNNTHGGTNTFSGTVTFSVPPVFTNKSGTRSALDLTSAATTSIGTSGATIPLLNGANTWSDVQTLSNVNLSITDGSTIRGYVGRGANTDGSFNANATVLRGDVQVGLSFNGGGGLILTSASSATLGGNTVYHAGNLPGSALTITSAWNFTGGLQRSGVDVVSLSATQTLTNKTLTSPTITTPTMTGGTSTASPGALTTTTGTLVAADANCIGTLTGGITLPNSVFSAGHGQIFRAGASARTITRGSGVTMYVNGSNVASATLAANGVGGASWESASVVYLVGQIT